MAKKRRYNNTMRNDRIFCREAFYKICEDAGMKKVHLFFIFMFNLNINGFSGRIVLFRNYHFDFVCLNLLAIRQGRDTSEGMHTFFMYSIVAHELEHIRISKGHNYEQSLQYELAAWHLCTEWKTQISKILTDIVYRRDISNLKKARYMVSLEEIICFRHGFISAFDACAEYLTDEDKHIAGILVDAADFIYNHIEIDYYNTKQAYNVFIYALKMIRKRQEIATRMHKKKTDWHEVPFVRILYSDDYKLMAPTKIYESRTDENKKLLDALLIHLFISLDIDWSSYFLNNTDFKKHIEKLANTYCAETINYLENMYKGEILLSKDVLQDNAAMLIKNTDLLNSLMKKYDMERTTGSIIPLYYL